MNSYVVAILCLVATVSSSHLGYGHVGYYAPNPAAHIPSGSVSVSHDGAVVAGPAGSIKTDNGLHSHSAGALVDGPAGQIATRGGHTTITGPGNEHDGGPVYAAGPAYAAGPIYAAAPAYAAGPVYAAAPAYAGYAAPVHAVPGVGAWGPAAGLVGGYGHGFGGLGYAGHGYGHGW